MKIYELLVKFALLNKRVKKADLITEPFCVVCFFSNTALGDTTFNTPVFRAFKAKFPNVKTIALLNPALKELFKTDPNLDEIIVYDGKWSGFFRTLKILKTKNIDIAFLLHSNEPQATPLAVLSGAKYIYKLANDKNQFAKFHSNAVEPFGEPRYVVLHRLEYLKFVGINSSDTRLELFLKDDDFIAVDKILGQQKRKLIGFQMGASTLSRQWFKQRWIELANLILQDENTCIVLTGSPAEMSMTAEFERDLNSKQLLNLAGKFSLRQAAALIARLDVLITPDTGPLHVAAAVKTPTIALFVVGSPTQSNPNFDTHIHKFIQKPKTCTPCISKKCKYAECMLQITASEVYEILRSII